jgi:multiple sugar transport system substrate-binding protein/raffinose/stachyose/melibiose transport system substrate-binding protein
VSSFGWVANDDSLPPGFSDKFFALAQSLFSNSDLEAQLAQLDADWDIAAGQ